MSRFLLTVLLVALALVAFLWKQSVEQTPPRPIEDGPPSRVSEKAPPESAPSPDALPGPENASVDEAVSPMPDWSGVVRAADSRRPIAGARVSIQVTPTGRWLRTTPGDHLVDLRTDDHGVFRLDVSSDRIAKSLPGWLCFDVTADGSAPLSRVDWIEGAGRPRPLGEFLLSPGREVSGVVLGPDGEPVSRASVGIHDGFTEEVGPYGLDASISTNEDGTFRVWVQGPCFWLVASAPGLALSQAEYSVTDLPPEPLTLRLGPAAELSGRVVDDLDRPIEGARVSVLVAGWPYGHTPIAESDAAGRFTVLGIPLGGEGWIVVEREGFRSYLSNTVPLAPEAGQPPLGERTFVLPRAHTVVVRVVDSGGELIVPAGLSLRTLTGSTVDLRPRGAQFEGELLSLESDAGVLSAEGFRKVPVAWQTAPLSSQSNRERVIDLGTVTLPEASAFRAIVVDSAGRAVAGARARLSFTFGERRASSHWVTAGPDGRFVIRDDAIGSSSSFECNVVAAGYAPARIEVTDRVEDEERRLELRQGATLSVRVRDEVGTPIASARVGPEAWWFDVAGFTDELGECRLRGCPPGAEITLTCGADGYLPNSVSVELLREGEVRAVDCVLESAAALECFVVDRMGEPIEGVAVYLESRSASTDASGRARLAKLVPGRHKVVVSRDGYSDEKRSIDVTHPKTQARFVLVPSDGVSFRGRVTDETGKPYPRLEVHAVSRGDRFRFDFVQTDHDGWFEVIFVPDAPVEITFMREVGSGYQETSFEASTPEELPESFTIPRGATLRFRVVDEAGRPFGGDVDLCFFDDEGDTMHDVEGEYDGARRFGELGVAEAVPSSVRRVVAYSPYGHGYDFEFDREVPRFESGQTYELTVIARSIGTPEKYSLEIVDTEGRPVSDSWVRIDPIEPSPWVEKGVSVHYVELRTGASGRVEWYGFPSREYRVLAESDGRRGDLTFQRGTPGRLVLSD